MHEHRPAAEVSKSGKALSQLSAISDDDEQEWRKATMNSTELSCHVYSDRGHMHKLRFRVDQI